MQNYFDREYGSGTWSNLTSECDLKSKFRLHLFFFYKTITNPTDLDRRIVEPAPPESKPSFSVPDRYYVPGDTADLHNRQVCSLHTQVTQVRGHRWGRLDEVVFPRFMEFGYVS